MFNLRISEGDDAQMLTIKNIERQMVSVGDPISQKIPSKTKEWVPRHVVHVGITNE